MSYHVASLEEMVIGEIHEEYGPTLEKKYELHLFDSVMRSPSSLAEAKKIVYDLLPIVCAECIVWTEQKDSVKCR